MDALITILILASGGMFLCACIGLINPRWVRLPNRTYTVGVWLLSVVLLVVAGALIPDSAPETSAQDQPVPEATPAEPAPEPMRAEVPPPAPQADPEIIWTEDGQMASLDVLSVERQTTSNWTLLRGQVKNVRGPLGRFFVTVAWFTADGQFLDAEVMGAAAERLAPGEVSEFTVIVGSEIPETAYFTLTFRFRGAPYGDRLPFRGARSARPPALFEVGPGVLACDSREPLETVLGHAAAGREIQMRSLMFQLVDERQCKILETGESVDVLGVREGGLAAIRQVEEYDYGGRRGSPLYWISWDALDASRR